MRVPLVMPTEMLIGSLVGSAVILLSWYLIYRIILAKLEKGNDYQTRKAKIRNRFIALIVETGICFLGFALINPYRLPLPPLSTAATAASEVGVLLSISSALAIPLTLGTLRY
jgi:hypothetical protein